MGACEEYLQREYELRITYLTNHLNRMWTRFNFFLIINTGLFALILGKANLELILFGGIFGIVMSLVWNQFSATDNYLVTVYRHQIEHAHFMLTTSPGFEGLHRRPPMMLKTLGFTGKVSEKYFDPEDCQIKTIRQGIFQRRYREISVTELGVILSSLYAIAWVAFLVITFMPP